MGTYTTNKNLFMPTVGETGWGELVNGNFSTIDTFLKPITISGSTYTFTGNHVGNQSGGSVSATSITNSGTLTQTGTSTFTGKITGNGGIGTTSLTTSSTITSTGLITANGGVKGNLTGNVTGNTTGLLFVKGTVGTSGDVNYATLAAQNFTGNENMSSTNPGSFTVNNYAIVFGNPQKITYGVYCRRSDLSNASVANVSTRNVTIAFNSTSSKAMYIYHKLSTDSKYTKTWIDDNSSLTFTLTVGKTYHWYLANVDNSTYNSKYGTVTIPAGTTYKVKYATP